MSQILRDLPQLFVKQKGLTIQFRISIRLTAAQTQKCCFYLKRRAQKP